VKVTDWAGELAEDQLNNGIIRVLVGENLVGVFGEIR